MKVMTARNIAIVTAPAIPAVSSMTRCRVAVNPKDRYLRYSPTYLNETMSIHTRATTGASRVDKLSLYFSLIARANKTVKSFAHYNEEKNLAAGTSVSAVHTGQ